ncbi:MAG: tripartite tricarboxylate transporter substrate binding protein [Burkholderiales bacterium]
MITLLSRWTACAALAATMAAAPTAFSQTWEPRKNNVEFVVGADPGGALDFTARLLQNIWKEQKTVDTVVVNKPGAGNAIGWTYLNTHPGDANYLAIASPNLFTNQLLGVSPMSYKDVTPLGVMLTEFIVVMVKPDSPYKTMKDIVAPLRKDPAALSIGMSPGIGSPAYTAAAIALSTAGVDAKNMRLIVYKSASAVLTALLSNDLDVAFVAAPNAPPMLSAKRLHAVAISSAARVSGELASVPTFREQGIDAVYENWRGLVGPKDLKPEQVAFWEKAILQATKTPEWQKALEKNGWGPRYLTSAEARKFWDSEYDKYKAIYTAVGAAK